MGLIDIAMRRPITVMVAVISMALMAVLALTRMSVDIFPALDLPVIYVVQPYGGMSPAQMESYFVYYYEYHFLYITGIDHIESRSIENVSLIKLQFHYGTDMAGAMAETVAQVERARAFMPPGTVGPFVLRYDASNVPVGYLVFTSQTRGTNEIQDLALNRVRPMFATLKGVSAPPPFGANQRSVVITIDPARLRSYNMSADEVIDAVSKGNKIIPAGDVRTGDLDRIAPLNSVVRDINELYMLPIRTGHGPTVFIRDVATVSDSTDIRTGYALVDGKRTVYAPITKRADASTLSVVNLVKENLPKMQALVPPDINVSFQFDQSVFVRDAIFELTREGLLGAGLTGLMILVFLADLRSAAIVVMSIPFAVLSALVALWLCGQTINIMTLGGLALAVGILVDEATVTIENIHVHLSRGELLPRAVLKAGRETLIPRLLAMLSVVSVFVPSFFMVGPTRSLFVPLSLAVGFAMLSSYVLSSTMVPVIATWFLKPSHTQAHTGERPRGLFHRIRERYLSTLGRLIRIRYAAVPLYFLLAAGLILVVYLQLGHQIFPRNDAGQFQLRLRAPTGTRFEVTEKLALKALGLIEQEEGRNNIDISIGYAGTQPPAYAISNVYLWTSGPHEAVLLVALKPGAPFSVEDLKERLRRRLPEELPGCTVSFEAGDIISRIMNFGSRTPIDVAIDGPDMALDRQHAAAILAEMKKIPVLRDVEFGQPQEYPTIDVEVNRERAGQLGVTFDRIGRSLVAATSSSRWIEENYWRDPKSGISYQVQVQMPQYNIGSVEDLEAVPAMPNGWEHPLIRDVAHVAYGTALGEIDRYNMQRMITVSANIIGDDLGKAMQEVGKAVKRAGNPPRGVFVSMRGQAKPMTDTFTGLQTGLMLAVLVIFLMLSANFQSFKLALVILGVIPAILCGEVVALWLTNTTVNVQSFMGSIMAIGVGVANAILLITFAETNRRGGQAALRAAMEAGRERLRPVLMTSLAMIAGMIPMATTAGAQASLGRAVIGGLLLSTPTVLLILPLIFSVVQQSAERTSGSIHPDDTLGVNNE